MLHNKKIYELKEKQLQELQGKTTIELTKRQKQIIDNLNQAKINIMLSDFSKKTGIPISTLYDSWKLICRNNEIKANITINGQEITTIQI